MSRAADIETTAPTVEDVLEQLVSFACDVFDASRDERLRGRAGAIIDAYVPEWVSAEDAERLRGNVDGSRTP